MKLSSLFSWPIFLLSLFLISIGVLVIYSSSVELSIQQSLYAGVGLLFFLFLSQLDLQIFKKIIKPLYFFTIILLIAVYILGIETRGSLRWIPLGFFNIQPSEFAKPVLILLMAFFWTSNIPNWKNILKSLLWALPAFFLIFKQPDLGSTLTVVAIWIGMLLATKISFKKVLILIAVSLVLIPGSWIFLQDYQKSRITSFLQPASDPLGTGYNVIQSTIAVGSGQLWGRGLGRGTQSRLQFLPEFRTDFIFASISEEMGFIGAVFILLIYLILLIYCLKIASSVENTFYFLIIIGVFSMLLFQIFINIGMNIGLLPITGITLPLISYGGSSIISTLICLGMVASIIKSKKHKFNQIIDTQTH